MYLINDHLKDYIKNNIENFEENNVHSVSYDLTVETINEPNTKKAIVLDDNNQYELKPGQTVFIGSKEVVQIKNNCIGLVNLRNSLIRMGISFSSPIYQPGHRTKIYTRITNESSNAILIGRSQSIVAIMFYELDDDTEPYKGKYQDQFDFTKTNQFDSAKMPEIVRIKKSEKNIKHIEQNIYTHVMTIMTIFIAVFSILNVNLNLFAHTPSLKMIIVYNLILLSSISLLVTLISAITEKVLESEKRMTFVLIIVTILLFLSTLFSYKLL